MCTVHKSAIETYCKRGIQAGVLASQVLRRWLSESAAFIVRWAVLYKCVGGGGGEEEELKQMRQHKSPLPPPSQQMGAVWSICGFLETQQFCNSEAQTDPFLASSSYSGYSGRHTRVPAVAPVSLSHRVDVQVCNWSLTFNTFTLLGVCEKLIWMN